MLVVSRSYKENGGESGIRTHGGLRLGGFQDRCLQPLDHLSGLVMSYLKCLINNFFQAQVEVFPEIIWRELRRGK